MLILMDMNGADGKYCKHTAAVLYALDTELTPFEEDKDWDTGEEAFIQKYLRP